MFCNKIYRSNRSSALKRDNNVMLYNFTNISENNFTTENFFHTQEK